MPTFAVFQLYRVVNTFVNFLFIKSSYVDLPFLQWWK